MVPLVPHSTREILMILMIVGKGTNKTTQLKYNLCTFCHRLQMFLQLARHTSEAIQKVTAMTKFGERIEILGVKKMHEIRTRRWWSVVQ